MKKKEQTKNIYEIQARIKSRKQYNESSSFSNDLIKRKSFRASHGRGENCIQTRVIFENGTTNRLVSLIIIKLNVKASALCAGGGVT